MTPAELLAELHRRGITVQLTDEGHLRLTGPAEAALTPDLRAEVATQRPALAAVLAPTVTGSAEAATEAPPAVQGAAASASPAEGSLRVPAWLFWAGLGVVVAILGGAYLVARPAAPTPVPPSLPATWPYSGQSWNW